MIYIARPTAKRIKINEAARERLEGAILKDFLDFLDFIKQERINTPWKSMYGYNMKYEGRIIGGITLLGAGGGEDIDEAKNRIHMGIATAYGKDYDKYLEGQPKEVIGLFMERINNRCSQCRPSSACSKGPGITIMAAGKRYKNICSLSAGFQLSSCNENMREMILLKHGGIPQKQEAVVPLDTVKALILAAKKYIEKEFR